MKQFYFIFFLLLFHSMDGRSQCRAKLTFESPDPMNLFLVQFYGVTDSNINQWFWDFGENGTSSSNKQNPQYTYTKAGSYIVTLIGYDTISNCFKQVSKPIEIPGTYKACRANFTVDSVDYNLFNFRDTSVFTTSGVMKKSWFWTFGDGENSMQQNPFHTYTKGGEYEVCLKITDSNANCISTFCDKVFAFTCESNFSAQKDTVGNTFHFIPEFSQGYNVTKIKWDFGDGDSSLEFAPYHTFADTGYYFVCMYSQNASICIDTACRTIYVPSINDCFFDFSIEQNRNILNFQIDTFKKKNDVYLWDYGDGNIDSGINVQHTYTGAGKFKVCVESTLGQLNCAYTVCKNIDIKKEIIIIPNNPGLRNSRISSNPIRGKTKLEWEQKPEGQVDIEIYDSLGKKLFTEQNIDKKDFFLNLPNLASGAYFYQVYNNGEIISKGKFIKLQN